jgi:D-alanyl-D-alanine carboxypeptidase
MGGVRRRLVASGALVLALTLGIGVLLPGPLGASVPNPKVMRALADDVRRGTNAPGAIVAVRRGRHAPVIVTSGTRDRRGGGPIQPDDAFVVASVSKAFTAALVLELVRRHRLGLDDSVAKYVPGWDRRITVRDLLSHRSGLPSWGNKDDPPNSLHGALEAADVNRRFTMAESLAPVMAMPLLSRPGTKTHYSNANTLLAGLVVEQVTGTSFAAALHRYLLDPLHLRSTGYAPQETPPKPPIPGVTYIDGTNVEIDTGQYPLDSQLTLDGPSAAMVSTAPDILRLAQVFLRGSFPTRRLAHQAHRIGSGGAGIGIIGFGPHGYCIFDGCPRNTPFRRIGFAGNGPGVAVRVVYDPARDTTVLVFANSGQRGKLDPFVIRLFKQIQ